MLSYLVSQRKHEIGVHIALGAGRGEIGRMVVRHGLVLSGVGVALGLGLAFYLSRWLQAHVLEIQVADPWLCPSSPGRRKENGAPHARRRPI